MTDYTKSTNFTSKDSLSTGNPLKIIKGAEFDTEFNAISTAVATKADINSPTFIGTVTIPTLAVTTFNPSSAVTVAQGGTGATTASAARTALGLAIGTDVQAYDADLTAFAAKTAPSGAVVGTTDTQTLTNKTIDASQLVDGSITPAKLNGAQSGSAPIFGARAWANFVGTGSVGSATINASGNVASVTKNATGDYTVTFTTAMADANYAISVFYSALVSRTTITSQTSSAVRFTLANTADNIDSTSVQIIVIR